MTQMGSRRGNVAKSPKIIIQRYSLNVVVPRQGEYCV